VNPPARGRTFETHSTGTTNRETRMYIGLGTLVIIIILLLILT
jgi:hypothetical protein